jgi:hypothetical protein
MSEIKEVTLSDVRAWAKKLHEDGNTLVLHWDGGGDSGWVHFEVDGRDLSTPEIEFLINWCYDELDYGSWAGEFSASGEAVYNPEEEAFIGIDCYSTEEYVSINDEDAIVFIVPASIKVDSVEINIEADGDEANINVEIRITHGFKTPEYRAIETKLQEEIEAKYYQIVDKYCKNGESFTPASCNRLFTKEEMILEDNGQHWVLKWDDADVNHWEKEDKDIVLSLKDNEDE